MCKEEEEERLQKEAATKAGTEGEVEEPEQMTDADDATKEEAKDKVSNKTLCIDTTLSPSKGKFQYIFTSLCVFVHEQSQAIYKETRLPLSLGRDQP